MDFYRVLFLLKISVTKPVYIVMQAVPGGGKLASAGQLSTGRELRAGWKNS
jgi:hypothetical protein